MYRNEQRQRSYERSIRRDKSALMELETARAETTNAEAIEKIVDGYNRTAYHMAETERKYLAFSVDNELKPQPSRMEVGGFGKEQEKEAAKAAAAWRAELQDK